MVLPPEPEPLDVREIWLSDQLSITLQSFLVGQDSEAQGSHPYAMTRDSRFAGSRLFSLIRHNQPIAVNMATQMQAGDIVWYVLDEEQGNAFARQFADDAGSLHEQHFFGEFVVKPAVQLSDLAFAYGIKVAPEEASRTLDGLFRERFGDVPVAGDRIDFDGICITVKQLDEQGNIQALGLKMPKKAQNPV